jgi:hypothetical protein
MNMNKTSPLSPISSQLSTETVQNGLKLQVPNQYASPHAFFRAFLPESVTQSPSNLSLQRVRQYSSSNHEVAIKSCWKDLTSRISNFAASIPNGYLSETGMTVTQYGMFMGWVAGGRMRSHGLLYLEESIFCGFLGSDGLPSGRGVGVSGSGKYVYFGNWNQGRIEGYGQERLYDGTLFYDGQYVNSQREGQGKEYFQGEVVYEGDFKNGLRDGYGTESSKRSIVFKGDFKLGKRHGQGELWQNCQRIYKGQFDDGKRHGFGIEYGSSNSPIYEGNWENDQRNGVGKELCRGTVLFEGHWKDNQKVGEDVYMDE